MSKKNNRKNTPGEAGISALNNIETKTEELMTSAEEKTRELKDSAGEKARELKDTAGEKTEEIKKAAEETAEAIKSGAEKTADTIRETAEKTVKSIKESAEETAETVRENAEDAADTIRENAEAVKASAEAVKASAESVKASADEKIEELKEETENFSEDLRALLSGDIEKMKKREKRRSLEILGVFAKHNFYANGLTPEELRSTLEDLGPTYVKIGQIMSSRVDLLPESYCKELEKLRQNVQELDPKLARAVIEQETGKKIEEIYSEFRDKPLGSASIGQAHYGVLMDGRKVVTKVRRPLIADMMRKDFVLLEKLAKGFNVVTEGEENSDNQLDLLAVLNEFKQVTEEELDFRIEAKNTRFFKENCIEDESKITCPDVVDELTTECIFTMSYVDGYSISKKDQVISDGYDVEQIGRSIVENYAHQVLDVGTFHADPHQGNIMVSHGIPVWIDFGMIGHLTEGDINIIQSLVMGVLEKDVEGIANGIMSMGATTPKTNRARLIEDLDIFLDRYCSVTSISDLNMAVLFDEIFNLTEKHHIKMPGRFTMLVRSIGTIEGVIEQFCPELNLFEVISGKMMDRAKQNFDLEKEIQAIGKDVLELGKKTAKIPVLVSDVLKGVARGRTKINMELTGYEELINRCADSIKHVVMSFFACIVFIGSCILCLSDIRPQAPGGIPVIAAVGLVFSVGLAIHALKHM